MNLQGTIRKIEDTQTFKSDFKKRNVILTTDEKYPQHVAIEFLQDKISILDNYNTGDQVKIAINIRGKEWINPEGVTKYFNSIVGWRIEKITTEKTTVPEPATPDHDFDLDVEEDDDGLPF